MSRILVIDDNDGIRDTLVRTLERAGFEAVAAKSGRDGLAEFHSRPADLVVTDVIMPDFDGIETIIALRQEAPEIPIIAVSGGGKAHAMQFLETARKLGADRTLSKPFKPAELVSAVSELLARDSSQKGAA